MGLGMTALGLFVGGVITIGIQQIKDWSNLGKVLTTIFSAAFAGGVFTFLEFFIKSKLVESLAFYPVGLALGLGLTNANGAFKNLQSENKNSQILGWVHIIALSIGSLIVLAVLFSPTLRAKLPH